jgi:hypothetical protein
MSGNMFFAHLFILLGLTLSLTSASLPPVQVLEARQQANTAVNTLSASDATTSSAIAASTSSSSLASAPTLVNEGGWAIRRTVEALGLLVLVAQLAQKVI